MTASRAVRVVNHLTANPDGATWRELAHLLGITWAHRVMDSGYHDVRTAVQNARELAERSGKVIPRPTPESSYRYRLEDKVGKDPSGLDGTFGGWLVGREDPVTRQRTLVHQAQVLIDSGSLTPFEARRLRRQQAKDVGRLVELEDDHASFERAFKRRNGSAAV